jgi:hypothetical protein
MKNLTSSPIWVSISSFIRNIGFAVTDNPCCYVITPSSYSGGQGFKFWSETGYYDRFCGYTPHRTTPGQHPILGHGRFLTNLYFTVF